MLDIPQHTTIPASSRTHPLADTYLLFIIMSHVIALILFIISGQAMARSKNQLVTTAAAYVATLKEQVPLSGTVSTARTSRLSTEVGGLIKAIYVDAGSHIKAGDRILELDNRLIAFTHQAAQAATSKAHAELAEAIRKYRDGKRLIEQKTISDSELKSLKATADIAKANIRKFEAEEALQKARLYKHNLTAPFEGVITKKEVEVGEWLQPGDEVATLNATDNLRIDFQAPQNIYPRVQPDSSITVKIKALGNQPMSAKILDIIPFSQPDSRAFLLRVSIPNETHAIIAGMSATAILDLDTGRKGIVIPRDAIMRYPDGRITVWVTQSQEHKTTVREKPVKTGVGFNGMVSILTGLQAGEHVVIRGNESLKNGQEVTLQP